MNYLNNYNLVGWVGGWEHRSGHSEATTKSGLTCLPALPSPPAVCEKNIFCFFRASASRK